MKEIKTILKKTIKITGVTCAATGAIALVASGTAVKATVEGFKSIHSSIKRILADEEIPEVSAVVE